MNNIRFPLIIPTTLNDYSRTKRNLEDFFALLPILKIVFIGPADLKESVEEEQRSTSLPIEFLDETDLISYDQLMGAMRNRLKAAGYEMADNSRPGWYYQQFLKMAYSQVCDYEYYMSWDADTIPLRKIDMFNPAGKPYFDIKPECLSGYFRTIQNLFGFGKVIAKSFVSEHMLFRVDYMKEMIAEIMRAPYDGNSFYEKIFFSIDLDNMKRGFSEFETYGTWVAMRHQTAYMLREWHSLRRAHCFLESRDLTEEDIKWLALDFDAATFEEYHTYEPELEQLFRNPEYRQKLRPMQFYQSILESGYFGEYSDGMLKRGDLLMPV